VVLNAYTLTFGGLLLLGGRAGDTLGRRRVFITGILLFSLASLLGGLATSSGWLLAARALQGVGGAIASPTALALVTTNFAEGPARNRAFGVFAAVSGSGAARWSFSRSFHRPQLHPTRPDSPESSTNLTWLDPTGP
jgi:MFS family permease